MSRYVVAIFLGNPGGRELIYVVTAKAIEDLVDSK